MINIWFQSVLGAAVRLASQISFTTNPPTEKVSGATTTLAGATVVNSKLSLPTATAYMAWPRVIFEAGQDFTIECKFNFSSIGTGQGGGGGGLMGVWDIGGASNANNLWLILCSPSGASFFIRNGTGTEPQVGISATTAIAANVDNHIAVTRKNGVLTIWTNGVASGPGGTYTGASKLSTLPCATRWYISNPSYDTGIVGTMWDIRIVTGAALYTSTFTPRPI